MGWNFYLIHETLSSLSSKWSYHINDFFDIVLKLIPTNLLWKFRRDRPYRRKKNKRYLIIHQIYTYRYNTSMFPRARPRGWANWCWVAREDVRVGYRNFFDFTNTELIRGSLNVNLQERAGCTPSVPSYFHIFRKSKSMRDKCWNIGGMMDIFFVLYNKLSTIRKLSHYTITI